jgi:hypothetical protein
VITDMDVRKFDLRAYEGECYRFVGTAPALAVGTLPQDPGLESRAYDKAGYNDAGPCLAPRTPTRQA